MLFFSNLLRVNTVNLPLPFCRFVANTKGTEKKGVEELTKPALVAIRRTQLFAAQHNCMHSKN